MGYRGNIVVQDGSERVYFYTHWSGDSIGEIAKAAIAHQERWDDPQYFAGIVAREMLRAIDPELRTFTGLGVSTSLGDNEYPIIVLDCNTQKAWRETGEGKRLEEPIGFGVVAKVGFPVLERA